MNRISSIAASGCNDDFSRKKIHEDVSGGFQVPLICSGIPLLIIAKADQLIIEK